MDKPSPKGDIFQANRDRAAPLLKKLRADGIGHLIDGKAVPSISGDTFETKSPIDSATLASVARGNAEDIDAAATSAALAFKTWRDMGPAMRRKLLYRVADAIEDNADDIAVLECIDTGQAYRFMAKAAIRAAENFRFFADKCAEARDGLNTPSDEHWNVSTRVPIGPVGVITPWNTLCHALDLEDRAPALAARLHRRAQAGQNGRRRRPSILSRLVKEAGVPDGVLNTVHGLGEEAGNGADRAPRHQGDRLCRRERDGFGDHGPGRADLEARISSSGGKNPGDRVRRCRSRPRARCRRVHDLLAQRRALHLLGAALLIQQDMMARTFIEKLTARKGAGGRSSPRSRHRDRAR